MKNTLLTSLLSLGLATAALAQEGNHQHQVTLELPTLQAGTQVTFRLRSTAIGQPARILVGRPAAHSYAAPHGLQLVSTQPGFAFQGNIGADGLLEIPISLPSPLGIPAGYPVAVQGAVLSQNGQGLFTDRHTLTVNPNQNATWVDRSSQIPASNLIESGEMVAVDYDRDGDRDLVLTGTTGLRFYTNQNGTLVDETATRIVAADNGVAFAVHAADFNLDGHQDLMVSGRLDPNDVPMASSIFHNDGTGSFSNAIGSTVLPMALEAHSVTAIGDIDGDGDLDILITDGGYHSGGVTPQTISLIRDQGGLQGGIQGAYLEDAVFAVGTFNQITNAAAGIDLGDVDNDGDLDIAVARANAEQNQLLLNDGVGGFTDATLQLPVFFDRSSDAEFADLDGDGYLDLIFMNSHVSTAPADSGDVLYNRGAVQPGFFEDGGTRFPDTFDEDLQIRLFSLTADIEGDGDLDIVMMPHEFFGSTSPFVGQPCLFLNQGGAQGGTEGVFIKDINFFHAGANPLDTFVSSGGALFDLDQDGDLEFYVGSSGGIVNPLNTEDFLLENVLL
ncbi:MAG: FG-GAP repeat domain-containing protein [Planctomycetota bacterium]